MARLKSCPSREASRAGRPRHTSRCGFVDTKLMGSVRRNRGIGGLSDDAKGEARLVLCVRNEGYPAGLELRKVYRVLATTTPALFPSLTARLKSCPPL